jgi:hypothetical protein
MRHKLRRAFLVSATLLMCGSPAYSQSDQEIVRVCMDRHGFERPLMDCTAHYISRRQAGPDGRIAIDCARRFGPGPDAMYCVLHNQSGPEMQLALDCARRHGGFNQQTGVCIAFNTVLKEVNPEWQMAAQCVAQYGVTKVAVGCAATRLTVAEFEKCKQGIGSSQGCFGPNNDIRRFVAGAYEAARRESSPVGGAVRFATGISPDAIRQHGPLGGPNSEARKACNAVAGIFGGRC